jgi:hypothetical protein
MDMQTADHQFPAPGPSRIFINVLLKALAATLPAGIADLAPRDEQLEAMRELLEAFDPRDAADAQLAAIGIASAYAALDGFARAAKAGMSHETVVKLRTSAFAAARAYATTRQTLRRPEPEPVAEPAPPQVENPPQPAATAPVQEPDEFQPRDRFGKPIPTLRTDLMTRAQVLATLSYPRNPELEAAAIAEEEAMIAAQAASDAENGGT